MSGSSAEIAENAIGLAVAAAVLVYLVVALVFPERF